jgi:hypothetical protein
MILTINRLDYTAALDGTSPLTIERTLNAPSLCRVALSLPPNGSLPAPARFQSVSVSGDAGPVYFTGYIAATPLPEYVGLALEGPRYRYRVEALSDEMLLDQAIASASRGASGLTAGALMSNLAVHSGSAALSTAGLDLEAPVARFTPAPGSPFSKTAGRVADQVRAAYRAQSGALRLNAIPATVHSLDEGDGTLTLAHLSLTRGARDLANDISVCGEHEPAAYVTEIFEGDGLTSSFYLSADPYCPPASESSLLSELFDKPVIDTSRWSNPSGDTYFSIGARGLAMNGGSGVAGQTRLSWLDPVEMGGTLVLEAEGLALQNASTGMLAAFFSGPANGGTCVAGFQAVAEQGSGAVSIQPLVDDAAEGPSFAIHPEHEYTLRMRVHCPEPQRTRASYICCGDNGTVAVGGQAVAASARLYLEVQECVDGVQGMPVLLYDGWVGGLPATCTVVAADSLNLHGSLRSLGLSNLGSAWVISTPRGGSPMTRRIGSAAQSAECSLSRSGKLTFFTGYTPGPSEQIAVTYRRIARAVGRAINAASQQALTAEGLPSTLSWTGSVTDPRARSSADCRNAAAALAQSAGSAAALWSGTYRGTNHDFADDVWPGDALAMSAPSCNLDAQLVIRSVRLTCHATVPDLVSYDIAFANDWAEDLAIATSASVPGDAWLPTPAPYTPIASLSALTVTSIDGANVTVNTGKAPPPGGGFEVRTRDYAFVPGEDPSLVLRGSEPNLTFTRQVAADRFYIRMFDGASPPNYSEFSAVVVLNVPLAG